MFSFFKHKNESGIIQHWMAAQLIFSLDLKHRIEDANFVSESRSFQTLASRTAKDFCEM